MRSAITFLPRVSLQVAFVGVSWLFAVVNYGECKFTPEALEPLFTGLAFVAVVATYNHERQQAHKREDEHQELLRQHQELLRQMQVQVRATCHAARISALVATIEADQTEMGSINLTGGLLTTGSAKTVQARRAELESRISGNRNGLAKASQITELL